MVELDRPPDDEQFARAQELEIEVMGPRHPGQPGENPGGRRGRWHHVHDAVDESFESWIQLGVSSPPTEILLTSGDTIITGWVGRFSNDQVLELVAQYSAD